MVKELTALFMFVSPATKHKIKMCDSTIWARKKSAPYFISVFF